MQASGGQRQLLQLGVALVSLGALILAIVIVTGDQHHHESFKALETAIVAALVALAIGAGTNLITRQPEIAAVGYLACGVASVAFILSSILIWQEEIFDNGVNDLNHWTWYLLIGTIALGVASVLLAGHDDDDTDAVKLTRLGTAFALFALFIAVIAEVRIPGHRVNSNVLGISAVAFVAGCLLLPLLSGLSRTDRDSLD